jgi:hypothetical protein
MLLPIYQTRWCHLNLGMWCLAVKFHDCKSVVMYLVLFADHLEDPKPSSLNGIKIFLLMLLGTLAVIACVVIGIMFYQKHQENSRKRFY